MTKKITTFVLVVALAAVAAAQGRKCWRAYNDASGPVLELQDGCRAALRATETWGNGHISMYTLAFPGKTGIELRTPHEAGTISAWAREEITLEVGSDRVGAIAVDKKGVRMSGAGEGGRLWLNGESPELWIDGHIGNRITAFAPPFATGEGVLVVVPYGASIAMFGDEKTCDDMGLYATHKDGAIVGCGW